MKFWPERESTGSEVLVVVVVLLIMLAIAFITAGDTWLSPYR